MPVNCRVIGYILCNRHMSGNLPLIHHLSDIYLEGRHGLSDNAGP